MSNDDGRSAVYPPALPREFVHDLRNCLGIAVATADLLLQGVDDGPRTSDLEKIRAACLRAVTVLDQWDSRHTRARGHRDVGVRRMAQIQAGGRHRT